LLAFTRQEGKRQQPGDDNGRPDQQDRRFGGRRQKRQQRIEPQEEEIRPWSRLNDGRVRGSTWTEGAEYAGTRANRQHDRAGEHDVLPDRVRDERHAISMRELAILLQVRRTPNDASGHRPFADPELQHEQNVDEDERDEQPWDEEDVQREESRQR